MNKEPRASAILQPYQTFDLTPLIEEYGDGEIDTCPILGVIAISGPPRSGKTRAVRALLESEFGESIRTVVMTEYLYACMRLCSLPETHLSYEEFKALPLGRERLIAASNRIKTLGQDLYMTMALSKNKAQYLLVDNCGFSHEIDFLKTLCADTVLLEVVLPFGIEHSGRDAKPFHEAFANGTRWPMDSRFSLSRYAQKTLGPHHVYTAVDSVAACQILSKYVFNREEQSPGIANTTFGTLFRIKRDATYAIKNKPML